jgi:hypothetical protein
VNLDIEPGYLPWNERWGHDSKTRRNDLKPPGKKIEDSVEAPWLVDFIVQRRATTLLATQANTPGALR